MTRERLALFKKLTEEKPPPKDFDGGSARDGVLNGKCLTVARRALLVWL